jgi:hypothetical protein
MGITLNNWLIECSMSWLLGRMLDVPSDIHPESLVLLL